MKNLSFKILIVDDDKDIPKLLEMYLSRLLKDACVFDRAHSFKEANRKIESSKYNLCIFDYDLGDGYGLDLLAKVVSDHDESGVIMMSANVSDKMIENFYTNGALLFIDKPLSFDQLNMVRPVIGELLYN